MDIKIREDEVLRFASLFEHGIEKASSDFSGLLAEATDYIDYLQRTGEEALRRISELEREIVETRRSLALAEGRAAAAEAAYQEEIATKPEDNIAPHRRSEA